MSDWSPTPEPRRLCGDCKHWMGADQWNDNTPGYCKHPNNQRKVAGRTLPGEVTAVDTCEWHEWPASFYVRHRVRYR